MTTAAPANNPLLSISLPALLALANPAASLPVQRRQIRALQNGQYLSRHKGRGMVFDETRLYQPGDDVRRIDWRVTARTDKPHSKIFREERETPVLISVDYRNSMQFATRGVFKAVQAAKLAGLLTWSAIQQGDRIGGQVFSDSGYQVLKPQTGKQGMLRFFSALARPRLYPANQPVTLNTSLMRLRHHAHPGSQVCIISDFRGFDADTERQLTELSRHCKVMLIQVYDPLEAQLPAQGRYRFTDGLREAMFDSSDRLRRQRYQQRFQQHQQDLQRLARKLRLSWVSCSTSDSPQQALLQLRQR